MREEMQIEWEGYDGVLW